MKIDPFSYVIYVLVNDHWHVGRHRVPNGFDFAWPDVNTAVGATFQVGGPGPVGPP